MTFALPLNLFGIKKSYVDVLDAKSLRLQMEILHGNVPNVESLAGKMDFNEPLPNGEIPLHYAVCQNQGQVVETLLTLGADPERRDHQNLNAIDHAVLMGNEKALALILGFKIGKELHEVQEQIQCKDSAAHLKRVQKEIKELLSIESIDMKKHTRESLIVSIAAYQGNLNVLTTLVNRQNVNDFDDNQLAPIHYAILGNQLPAVEKLLEMGSHVKMETREGHSLLHFAAVSGSSKILNKLLEFKVDPNSKNVHGQTPLHFAALKENLSFMEILVKAGADLSIKDHEEMSPLSMIGASAYQRDPLALSDAQIMMFISALTITASKYALNTRIFSDLLSGVLLNTALRATNWLKFTAEIVFLVSQPRMNLTNMPGANYFAKAQNLMLLISLLNYFYNDSSINIVLQTFNGVWLTYSFPFQMLRTYSVASSAFEGMKKSWKNAGNRKVDAIRNVVVNGVNTVFSAKQLHNQMSALPFASYFLSKAKLWSVSTLPLTIKQRMAVLDPKETEQALAIICPQCTMTQLDTDGEKIFKTSYREAALQLHPDKHRDDTVAATVSFQRLGQAKETLEKYLNGICVQSPFPL